MTKFGDYRDTFPVGSRVQLESGVEGEVVDIDFIPTYSFFKTIASTPQYKADKQKVWIKPDSSAFARCE